MELPKILNLEIYPTPSGTVSYKAHTIDGDIVNDGRGGATYFRPTTDKGKQYMRVDEWDWENHIEAYEDMLVGGQ
jgi:hypothetical protein